MNRIICIFIICIVGVLSTLAYSGVADEDVFSTEPNVRNGRAKFRIAYYEPGPYIDYQEIFMATISGLMHHGWIDPTRLPTLRGERTDYIWKWLINETRSQHIEFVEDGHYSAGWDIPTHEKMSKEMLERLKEGEIDLLIATGTLSGLAFANDKHNTPVVVISTSNALESGIIKSLEDSGHEHVHGSVDPDKYYRQIQMFHEITNFDTLGIAYENTKNGRTYAGIEAVKRVAERRNFKVYSCYVLDDTASDMETRNKTSTDCYEKLSKRVDAIYVTAQGGVNLNNLPNLVKIFNKHKVLTFSQSGPREVKNGLMLSLSQGSQNYVGMFHAKTIAKILNGARPNQLIQVYHEPPKVSINLETAKIVGFKPPMLLLGLADNVYNKIHTEEAD